MSLLSRKILGSGSRRHRSVRGVLAVIIGLLLMIVIAVLLPPVRGMAMRKGLSLASAHIPGELTWSRASWPGLGRVELSDLAWVDDGDTLLFLNRVAVELALGDLVRRDLVIRNVEVLGVRADVPRLQEAALALAPVDTSQTRTPTSPPKFPRMGSLANVPSLAVESVRITLQHVVLDSATTIRNGKIVTRADLRVGHRPWVVLDTLSVDALLPSGEIALLQVTGTADETFDLNLALKNASDVVVDIAGSGALRIDPMEFTIELSGRAADISLKHLGLKATSPNGVEGPVTIDFRAVALDLDLITQAVASFGDSIIVDVAPFDVVVDTTDVLLQRQPGRTNGRVILADDTQSLTNITISGALGELQFDAVHGKDRLEAELMVRWPTAPAALKARANIGSMIWPTEIEPGIDASILLQPSSRGGSLDQGQAEVFLRLPGPRHFAPLMPPGTLVDDLDAITGQAVAVLEPESVWDVRLDLSSTSWLESALVVARGSGANVELDSLALIVPGLNVSARGSLVDDAIDIVAHLSMPDASLLNRFPDTPPDSDVMVHFDLTASGSPTAPAIEAGLVADMDIAGVTTSNVTVSISADPDTLFVRLDAPEGLATPTLEFHRISAILTGGGLEQIQDHLHFDLSAIGDDLGIQTTGSISGGEYPSAVIDTFRVTVQGEDIGTRSPITLQRDKTTQAWLLDGVDLVGSLGAFSANGFLAADSLSFDADIDLRIPLTLIQMLSPDVVLPRHEDLEAVFSGQVSLDGTATNPRFSGDVTAGLQGDDNLDSLSAKITLGVGIETKPGLSAGLGLDLDGHTLVSGHVSVPAVVSLDPPAFVPSDRDSFRLMIQMIPTEINDLARFLPAGLDLGGVVAAELNLTGLNQIAMLDGDFSADKLRLDLDDGTWLELDAHLDIGGSTLRPDLSGGMNIAGGVIVIPEVPPLLLPVEGEAMLRTAALAGSDQDTLTSVAPDTIAPLEMDLDITIDCPGNLWLRGRGLAIELAGDLRITQSGAEPAIVGDLQTISGTLQFMGRNFEMERGNVVFYGDLATDPILDLELITTLEGTVYRIAVSGPALTPTLRLSAEPDLSEGDIIASLIFGKPLDQLDEGQENLLKDRTAQVLASLGAVELSDRLTSTIGADLISYDQGDGDESSSLMIGKYLNPKVLLKYEQLLDRRNAFFVRLNYMLSRNFQLETSVGQGTESGVEVKWARDY